MKSNTEGSIEVLKESRPRGASCMGFRPRIMMKKRMVPRTYLSAVS